MEQGKVFKYEVFAESVRGVNAENAGQTQITRSSLRPSLYLSDCVCLPGGFGVLGLARREPVWGI